MSYEVDPSGDLSIDELALRCEEVYAREIFEFGEVNGLPEEFESTEICTELRTAFEQKYLLVNRSNWVNSLDNFNESGLVLPVIGTKHRPLLNMILLQDPSAYLPDAKFDGGPIKFSTEGILSLPYIDINLDYSDTVEYGPYNGPHLISWVDDSMSSLLKLPINYLSPGQHKIKIPFKSVDVPVKYLEISAN